MAVAQGGIGKFHRTKVMFSILIQNEVIQINGY